MSRAIYSLKLVMFADQLTLTPEETKSLTSFCIFVIFVYVKYWYTLKSAITAPENDLKFLRDLMQYNEIDKPISDIAVKKFSGHLWYLSEE